MTTTTNVTGPPLRLSFNLEVAVPLEALNALEDPDVGGRIVGRLTPTQVAAAMAMLQEAGLPGDTPGLVIAASLQASGGVQIAVTQDT
jgi:hypothetical protein